jgi:hypothetical protein
VTWIPEDVTGQIDGLTDTFNTTFERNLGKLVVFYIDGATSDTRQIHNSEFTELNSVQIRLSFVPSLTNGDKLTIEYDTDQTLSGRVQGFTACPPGGTTPVLPKSLEDILAEHEECLDELKLENADQEARIEALELSGGGPGGGGEVVRNFPSTQALSIGDLVYITSIGDVELATATDINTEPVVGAVSAVNVPSAGRFDVIQSGHALGFSGLSTGDRYILSKAPGKAVRHDDALNPDYPDQPGEFIQIVGVASSPTTLWIEIDLTTTFVIS